MPETSDAAYDAYLRQDPALAAELRHLFAPESVTVVLDIGACEGEDSLRYARLFPRARVFAFEPLPANQALVRRHFARHHADRCELVPLALSDRTGTATFHVSSGRPEEKFAGEDWNYGNKSSSLLPPGRVGTEWLPWLKFEQTVTVETATLDSFCAARGLAQIDFAHLDVQGAEWLVLQGAQKTLPHLVALWIEVADTPVYEGQRTRAEIAAFLESRGFAIAYEELRDVESDQLYVNTAFPAGRRRARAARARRRWQQFRIELGRWRRRLLPFP